VKPIRLKPKPLEPREVVFGNTTGLRLGSDSVHDTKQSAAATQA
jgi:hypothetical protein